MPETEVAVFAKAPVPGYAKTRLIPALGPEGAAALQGRLTARALATATAAAVGPVTLWGTPDDADPELRARAAEVGTDLRAQVPGDLGAKMLGAFVAAAGPLVLIGTDCPCLTPEDLRAAAAHLRAGTDVVMAPAEDGGYGLIAMRTPHETLFREMPWGTERVASETRARSSAAGLRLVELRIVWDVDTPADYERLLRSGLLKEGGTA